MRPKANIYQKVAAQQTMVVIMYGWIEGKRDSDNNLTVWECVQQFAKEKDIDCDVHTLYQQYKSYAATFREFQKDKNK
ncbi:MAG: hypothetical protein WAT92_00235 [Saprospiraceae bacterium]